MHYRSALSLVLFASALLAQAQIEVVVYLSSDHPPPSAVVHAMEQETEFLVAPAGVHLAWKSTPDSEVSGRIAMIRMAGQCRPEGALAAPGSQSLGQTQMIHGQVLPFAEVRCDAVRNVIARGLRSAVASDREGLLGRALGRVLAHELYHILLRTSSHGRSGLARPSQSSSDLLSERSGFTPSDSENLAAAGSR